VTPEILEKTLYVHMVALAAHVLFPSDNDGGRVGLICTKAIVAAPAVRRWKYGCEVAEEKLADVNGELGDYARGMAWRC
jgi:hypothetical protein